MKGDVISAVKYFANSINSRSKVVADMSTLIDITSKLPLKSFDYWERIIRTEFSLALRQSEEAKRNVWPKPSGLLTWLDLISQDGFRREKTLRTLAGGAPNAFFFSLALRRLNDWVPQVRNAARESLPAIAKSTNPEFVVEALCISLSNWNSWGRIEDIDRDVILNIISSEGMSESLLTKVVSAASGPIPSLFSQLGRTQILDECIEEIAKSAVQPAVRAKAYRCLFNCEVSWVEGAKWEWVDIRYCDGRLKPTIASRQINVDTPLLTLLKLSSEDSSSIVRRISAEILIRDLSSIGVGAMEFALRFSTDKSQAVSERGLFALKKLKEIDTGIVN